MSLQDLALVGRDSLIPPPLQNDEALLLIRAARRAQLEGLITRIESLRDIDAILGRVR